ncbi:hypothetical protein VZT92_026308 [Zoarces viviparus]|uniref:Uncharacterized protein n=1 Tax=Zoarces viviparus TaxID=48416 RepID=A0AAW1DZG7_ZOAVI
MESSPFFPVTLTGNQMDVWSTSPVLLSLSKASTHRAEVSPTTRATSISLRGGTAEHLLQPPCRGNEGETEQRFAQSDLKLDTSARLYPLETGSFGLRSGSVRHGPDQRDGSLNHLLPGSPFVSFRFPSLLCDCHSSVQ